MQHHYSIIGIRAIDENMTSSTKPEVYTVSRCCQRRTTNGRKEMHKKLVKFSGVVFILRVEA